VNATIDDLRARVPEHSGRRVAVRATADAIRQVRGGSPWLYEGSITSVGHDGDAGDLAVVFDDRRRFVAIGLWDPASVIRLKVLHSGKPVAIDDAWFVSGFARALDARSALVADSETTAYRWVHGENDGFPGLVVDRYDTTLVIKLYSGAWFPHLAVVVEALLGLAAVDRVVLRLARTVLAGETFGFTDGSTIIGCPPDRPVRFRERGITMEADVVGGQKTGHFIDQRDNRGLVRALAEGAAVLDLFASTGGFSLAAAAGGAASVHLVDQSVPALDAARRNFAANGPIVQVRHCAVRYTVGDVFEVMAQLAREGETYDVVVIDPPSFAQNQASVERALRAYARLTYLSARLVRPGGTLVQASCSSRVTADDFFLTVRESAENSGRRFDEIRRTGHAVDHPIGF